MYREVRGLHQAAYILALFALGSQLLAIVRDRLLAHTFGAGVELDVYYAAFRVPDLLFVLFASVLSIYVLLPFVHRYSETGGVAHGARVLSQVFTLFLLGYTLLAGLLALLAPWYVTWLFPGLAAEAETLTTLLRILLLQPLHLALLTVAHCALCIKHKPRNHCLLYYFADCGASCPLHQGQVQESLPYVITLLPPTNSSVYLYLSPHR